MQRKAQHVVPRSYGWAVRSSGSARVSHRFATQEEAISVGRELARRQHTRLYIHGADGRIHERISYGADAQPPEG